MSGVWNRRKTLSVLPTQPPINGDEAFSEPSDNPNSIPTLSPSRTTPRLGKRASVSSIAAISSSYNLPSRSYVHHAGHHRAQGQINPLHGLRCISTKSPADSVRYSSSGVREQTAELSSSFINNSSTFERRLRADSDISIPTGASPRRHEPITEIPEPESASGSRENVTASGLTEAFREQQQPRERLLSSESISGEDRASSHIPDLLLAEEDSADMHETTPLLPQERLSSSKRQRYDVEANEDTESRYKPGAWNRLGHHYPTLRYLPSKLHHIVTNPKSIDFRKAAHKCVVEPFYLLPAVFLGVLLNLLDALSYGIILFPLGEEVFKDLGPDGVSMFYVSCIISQLVYSTGSIFRGGVGSEMIEVVPFFHKMTYLIMGQMIDASPEALRATVIVSYAMSSIITGIVFFGLGAARLGTLVNFFPHSILTGCIGGVGIFLFITGKTLEF